jgi:putative tryptophan/tyrosine transport system substrate-binding protein
MKRREFIAGVAGAAAACPVVALAQQGALPVVAFLNGSTPGASTRYTAAFRAGLKESGYTEGQNLTIEFRRRVAVIATPGDATSAIAAKAATGTIPIVFSIGVDPVRLGLVATIARPGGNATGMNFFAQEAVPKRLGMLHEVMPNASPIAVLVDPSDHGTSEFTLREVHIAAGQAGLPIKVFHASTNREIDGVFATLVAQRIQALLVGPGG